MPRMVLRVERARESVPIFDFSKSSFRNSTKSFNWKEG